MQRLIQTLALVFLGAILPVLWRPDSVGAQTPLLEVDKGAVKLMQVNDDGGLVAYGSGDIGIIPANGPGIRLMWYPRKAAFRAGSAVGTEWDDANIGSRSFAIGFNTTASGDRSTAMGSGTTASGPQSTAMGNGTTASGPQSTAMGLQTTASGFFSTAMGRLTVADGNASTAMGSETRAIGPSSTAMGFRTTAVGVASTAMGSNAAAVGPGSFAYGDNSTTDVFLTDPNQFGVRASGGFRFRTSPNESTGCDLGPGAADWACTSSRLAKEDFEEVDGEQVLDKLAGMPIQRWRYLGTRAWHIGPVAEDFHAAFGLGQGPTTISTVDADGISLLAVQALERRTAELREENAALRAKLAEDTATLRTELEALRRIVETGRVAP